MTPTKTIFAALATLVLSQTSLATTLINGAGATFPQPIYTKWFAEYAKVNKAATINYQAIGSGGGVRQLISGTVDFGASDEPLTNAESGKIKGGVVHIPTVLGAVALSYNLSLSAPLKLDGELVSAIYMGTVKKWNDPKIAALNPGIKLPDLAIVPAYRSDGSGTTAVFTEWLSKVSKTFETSVGKGKSVSWPTGIGAKGNAGVAGVIAQNPGSIGYVELVFAATNKLAVAEIKNKSGNFVAPSTTSVSAAAAGKAKEMIAADFKISITDSDAKGAYPISSFTWLIVPAEIEKTRGEPLIAFLNWAIGPVGQKMATELNYAPLPTDITAALTERIKTIKAVAKGS